MNRERWLLAASILMIVGVAVYHLRPGEGIRPTRPTASSQRPAPTPLKQTASAESQPHVTVERGTVAEPISWGRNPFLTEQEELGAKSWRPDEGLQVKAVIVGQPRRVATLNGQSVVVGDMVGEETVREIRPDAVVLEKDGRQRVVRIHQPSIAIEVKEGRR